MDSQKQKLFETQISDLKDSLTRSHADNLSLQKENRLNEIRIRELKREQQKNLEEKAQIMRDMKDVRDENRKMKEALRQNENFFVKQKSQMENIIREKDTMAIQLIKMTEENATLQKNLSLLKMTLDKGNAMYNERLSDIEFLKIEIKNLRGQCHVLQQSLCNTTDMRHEVLQLHRKLNQERVRVRVLMEEMNTPMNIHRWRKLGGKDLNRMELIQKYHLAQKRIMKQSQKIIEAEKIVQKYRKENEKLILWADREPNRQILEKLILAKTQLNKNLRKTKSAIAISRSKDCDLKERDILIDCMKKELHYLKLQLAKEKRMRVKMQEDIINNNKKMNSSETAQRNRNILKPLQHMEQNSQVDFKVVCKPLKKNLRNSRSSVGY